MTKLEVQNANVSVVWVDMTDNDHGRIPDNLVKLTMTVLTMHRANGDLGWVADTAHELESERPA